jgi:hypothetical protein
VLIIKVFFGFEMHTDMFPFFPQGECHLQPNSCQQSELYHNRSPTDHIMLACEVLKEHRNIGVLCTVYFTTHSWNVCRYVYIC